MEAEEIPVQQECILEILECSGVEVESIFNESDGGCSADNNFSSVNGSIIDIEVEQGSSVPVPEPAISSDDDTAFPKLKRKHDKSSCASQLKFKDKDAVLHLLLNSTTGMCTVPNKAEENCYILIDKRNVRKNRRLCRKQAFNIDDNKDWIFSSLKRHHFIMSDGTFEYVQKIDGTYHLPIPSSQCNKNGRKISKQLFKCNKKGQKAASQPRHTKNVIKLMKQPANEDILILTMTYGSIGDFKRRISFIEKCPGNVTQKQENLIVAEYSSLSGEDSPAKLPKLETPEKVSKQKKASLRRSRRRNSRTGDTGILDDLENIIASISNEQAIAANEVVFLEKNDLIEKHLQARTTLEEIPVGKKENEVIIIKNDENRKREAEGKKRLYIDDCGVWRKISVKKCWFVKIDGKYENVRYADGKYEIVNAAIRSRNPALKKSDILGMRWVYGTLRRAQEYRRRISWIDSFPKGVTPKQRHIAIAEYIGKYPGTNDAPHGNQKKDGGNPYVRTSSKVMKKMKEQLVSKTASQVVADDPGLQSTPQLRKKLENLRYRNSLRVGPGSVGTIEVMQDLLSLVQFNPYVQQVTFVKKKSPLMIAYTPEHINAWKFRLSKDSEFRVMGVDCTMTIGPLYLTMVTYLHPNLLCRRTGLNAVMLGPVLMHIDRSIHVYSSFFNHVRDKLGCYGPYTFDGITLALGPREDQPLLEALDSCFPSCKMGHCVEHLENELRTFLTSEIGLTKDEVNHITNELFSRLMSCKDEFDFDTRLTHLQSAYDVANPKLGAFFRKLGNDIKFKCWQPTIQGVPSMKWSLEGCPALQNIANSVESLEDVRMSSVILKIQQAANSQLEDEILAIYDKGPYVLASHAMKYFHEENEWSEKPAKQKSKVIDGLRKDKHTLKHQTRKNRKNFQL